MYSLRPKYKELNKKGLISHIKKCFSYAVAQNNGNSKNLAKNLRCISEHLFNKHDNCGTWCKKVSGNKSGLYQPKFIIKCEELYNECY